MKLAELSFACYLYSNMTSYDESYAEFEDIINRQLDLTQRQHRKALLNWLNKWGCRQFSLEYHKLAAREISRWFKASGPRLFPADLTLLSLSDKDLKVVEQVYDLLAGQSASWKETKSGKKSRVPVGPTGASKILFALRPLALIPWDEAIRKGLKYDGSGRSYLDYLRRAKDDLHGLEYDCQRKGHKLEDVPRLLSRTNPSLVKLVGEYYWVTVSQGCAFPLKKDIQLWTT